MKAESYSSRVSRSFNHLTPKNNHRPLALPADLKQQPGKGSEQPENKLIV